MRQPGIGDLVVPQFELGQLARFCHVGGVSVNESPVHQLQLRQSLQGTQMSKLGVLNPAVSRIGQREGGESSQPLEVLQAGAGHISKWAPQVEPPKLWYSANVFQSGIGETVA